MLMPSVRAMLRPPALFFGVFPPFPGIIAFVILIFKLPQAAWHGHLTRKIYAGMLLLGAILAAGLMYFGPQLAALGGATGFVLDGAAWGTALGSFLALVFYRSLPKKPG